VVEPTQSNLRFDMGVVRVKYLSTTRRRLRLVDIDTINSLQMAGEP
jgi:hypothetical protein